MTIKNYNFKVFRNIKKNPRLSINNYRKKISDQPGRILAVTFFSPMIAYKGYSYQDPFLLTFASILFTWDLYWIMSKPSVKILDE